VAPRIVGDRAAVTRAGELLAKAKNPVIIAGDAVAHGDASLSWPRWRSCSGRPSLPKACRARARSRSRIRSTRARCRASAPPIPRLLMRHDLVFSSAATLFTLSLPDDVDPMPPGSRWSTST
jgi:benzoylformate decarboxylase